MNVQDNNSTSQENEDLSTQKDDVQNENAPPLEILNIEQDETSNKSKENLIDESKLLEQSRKRKRSDSVELESAVDVSNILQTKKTKKSKPTTESPIDKEGGSPRKKKKYPFSGVKSGYTSRTKRRKSSSDTSSKGSPVLRNKVLNEIPKEDLFGYDIKSSIVKLTRYSISQLEKIKEELLNKSHIKESNTEEEIKFCNLQSPEEIDLSGKNFTCKLGASPDSYDVKIVSVKPSHVLSKSPSMEDIHTISDETSVKDESSSIPNSGRPSRLKTSNNAKSQNRHNKKDTSETSLKNTGNGDKSKSVEVEDNNDVKLVDQCNVETVQKDEEYKMDFGRFTGAILVIKVSICIMKLKRN